ncbi:hypothetical protein ADIARSV_1410 [Arcticibacter svalbardensis MN12-7]|uniref:Uncharacterized protein n=1 Tax=Arcticibacter svalbardensis MN12-7 TaxID=1150600 RepID=R9H2G4_9SPHI|nr:hypothetical protein ADIARSV_1410 [Arcticibacter svalbardensis MN12-7]
MNIYCPADPSISRQAAKSPRFTYHFFRVRYSGSNCVAQLLQNWLDGFRTT